MPRMTQEDGGATDPLLTAAEVGELLGISSRMVLCLPIKQIRIGPRTIRFRLQDIYDYLGLEDPHK